MVTFKTRGFLPDSYRHWLLISTEIFFFLNWDSPHARLNSHYEAWSYKKKKAQKRLQDTENLFTKNLLLKDVC